MRTAFPVLGLTFRSATVLSLQKKVLNFLGLTLLILQNAGQVDCDDKVSYVSTE